jgi:hypothetical protein
MVFGAALWGVPGRRGAAVLSSTLRHTEVGDASPHRGGRGDGGGGIRYTRPPCRRRRGAGKLRGASLVYNPLPQNVFSNAYPRDNFFGRIPNLTWNSVPQTSFNPINCLIE